MKRISIDFWMAAVENDNGLPILMSGMRRKINKQIDRWAF